MKSLKFVSKKIQLAVLAISFALPNLALADALPMPPVPGSEKGDKGGNGGEISEISVRIMAYKLERFLTTSEGRSVLSDVDANQFHETVLKTDIKVTDENLVDQKGDPRSTLNISGERNLIIFNRAALEAFKDDVPEQFVLVFHEYLNLMGIELVSGPKSFFKPSSIYTTSAKIIPYLGQVLLNGIVHRVDDAERDPLGLSWRFILAET